MVGEDDDDGGEFSRLARSKVKGLSEDPGDDGELED